MDFTLGKIYRIYNPSIENSKEYVGSTCQPYLSTRMALHRDAYKRNHIISCSSSNLFTEYGVENCIIELLEKCPCIDRQELLRREGQLIQERNTVNKRGAGYTEEQRKAYDHLPSTLKMRNDYTKARYATPEGRAKALAYGKARYARLKAEKEKTVLEDV
jgi:hypothetical protein